jgi:hypothetical protein
MFDAFKTGAWFPITMTFLLYLDLCESQARPETTWNLFPIIHLRLYYTPFSRIREQKVSGGEKQKSGLQVTKD